MSQYMREGTGQEIVRALGGTPPQGNPAAAQALYVTEATGRAILAAVENGGGGGGVVSIITNPATTLTLQPCPVTYKWGEVAELTLTVTSDTEYHFMFTCPSSAATVLTITGETQRTGDTLEAGKTYEVDIWAGVTLIREVSAA